MKWVVLFLVGLPGLAGGYYFWEFVQWLELPPWTKPWDSIVVGVGTIWVIQWLAQGVAERMFK